MHIWETGLHGEKEGSRGLGPIEQEKGQRGQGPSEMGKTVDPLHVGCEKEDSSKMLSLEEGTFLGA